MSDAESFDSVASATLLADSDSDRGRDYSRFAKFASFATRNTCAKDARSTKQI